VVDFTVWGGFYFGTYYEDLDSPPCLSIFSRKCLEVIAAFIQYLVSDFSLRGAHTFLWAAWLSIFFWLKTKYPGRKVGTYFFIISFFLFFSFIIYQF